MGAYMKTIKLKPSDRLTCTMSVEVVGLDLRPDGQVEIHFEFFHVLASIVVSHERATEMLGAGWGDR